jgi:hypothetical protein
MLVLILSPSWTGLHYSLADRMEFPVVWSERTCCLESRWHRCEGQ